jgi:hypothetical protein
LKQRAEEKLADPGQGLRAEEAAVIGFLARQLEDEDATTKIDIAAAGRKAALHAPAPEGGVPRNNQGEMARQSG